MQSSSKLTIGMLVGVVLLTLATFLVPVSASMASMPGLFYWSLAATTAQAAAYIGAAILLMLGVQVYKAKLRAAYIAIAVSIVITALGTIQLPLIDIFELGNTALVKGGIIVLPFVLSGLIVYFGARGFARLVGITSFLTRGSLVLPGIIVIVVASTFLPHGAISTDEMTYDISNGILLWSGLFYASAAGVAWQAWRHTGEHYKPATLWLFMGLALAAVIIVVSLLHNLLISAAQDPILSALLDTLGIGCALSYIGAAHEFMKTKEY